MISYPAIKHLHMACAATSGAVFLLRVYWKARAPAMLEKKPVKILPHLIDTLLLASALTMVFWRAQYPFVQHWLTAKVLALLVYIVAGSIALKRGRTAAARRYALLIAVLSYAYIVAVALHHSAFPF